MLRDDWFTRWKNDKRHGINFSNVFEEKHWLTQLDIEKEGLLHIDETELNFIRLPEKIFFASSKNSVPGRQGDYVVFECLWNS